MNKPIIFADMDGCLASQSKIWRHQKDGALTVSKAISDHDSWCIDHYKKHAHIVIISGDERINRAWAERRDVPFIFTAAAGFHQDKWEFLVDYMVENHADRIGPLNCPVTNVHVRGTYYYLGDAMPDWQCMLNSKRAFVPLDASHFITNKMEHHKNMEWMCVNSGQGCFDEMAWLLVKEGVLPDVN